MVFTCLYRKNNAAATGFDHLSPGILQCLLEAGSRIGKLEFGSNQEVFRYGYCCMLFLVWINPNDEVSGRNLLEVPGCAILYFGGSPYFSFCPFQGTNLL